MRRTLRPGGYSTLLLSDLLHFADAHGALVDALRALLARTPGARAYVAAGRYTPAAVCAQFVGMAGGAGVVLEEQDVGGEEGWRGTLPVGDLDAAQLAVRKGMCRWWIGRWREGHVQQI